MQDPRQTFAAILLIGDELVEGRVADAFGAEIARRLRSLGCRVTIWTVLPDDRDTIVSAAQALISLGVRVLISSGGRGSTDDDPLGRAMAELTGRELAVDRRLLARIQTSRGPGPAPDHVLVAERRQATIPRGAIWIGPARGGTAPALVIPASEATDGAVIAALPGSPRELRELLPQVLDRDELRGVVATGSPWVVRELRFFGEDESAIDETVRKARDRLSLENVSISICFVEEGPGEVTLVAGFPVSAHRQYNELEARILSAHHGHVFSTDGRSVDTIDAELLRGRTVAVADAAGGTTVARLRASGIDAVGLMLDARDRRALAEVAGVGADRRGPKWLSETLTDRCRTMFHTEWGVGLVRDADTTHISVAASEVTRITRSVSFDHGEAGLARLEATWALHMLRDRLQWEIHAPASRA